LNTEVRREVRTMRTTAGRVDAVFIRKSSPGQDEQGQKDNVQAMLKVRGVYVPADRWFVGTVSRRKVKSNADFNRLMELVEADRLGTVYVESQDRWGTADRPELFSLLGTLRQHDTRLYDLRANKDLTEKDLATEMLAFVNSIKSQKELEDISYRSLRTRVNNFKETGSWPTGSHPYGYGKRCYGPDGRLLWEFQPVNRSRGQIFYPDPSGKLTPGPADVKIPRKAKGGRLVLVPSNNPAYVHAVKLVFDLYVRVGLSRRQISARLNAQGLTFNGGPFTHPDITNILQNPAYAGDTVFGKVQNGVYHTFDAQGLIVEVKRKRDDPHRDAAECLVRQNTHEALVDRKTWALAQEKLAAERERTNYAPRNPAYYLKPLFVCGHCGKNLAGRTETDPDTGHKRVVYVCSSYVAGRCNGHPSTCGYYRIGHGEAERLLLDKVRELNLPFEENASAGARANLQARLARLGHEDEESVAQWQRWFAEGIDALADYLVEAHPEAGEHPAVQKVRKLGMSYYCGDLDEKPDGYRPFKALPVDLAELRSAVQEAEEAAVAQARRKVAELKEEHRAYTKAWAKASDLQQGVLKEEIDRLEREVREWEPRTVPLSKRLEAVYAAEAEREVERKKLLAEYPALEAREKGEALRRLFKTVTLFWEGTFHPAAPKRNRPRKTDRPGRYRYTLKKDAIRWAFAASELESSW
jgi:hypothetical protein